MSSRRRSFFSPAGTSLPQLSPYPNSPKSAIPPTPRPPRSILASPLAVFSAASSQPDTPFSPVPHIVRRFGRGVRAGRSGAIGGLVTSLLALWLLVSLFSKRPPPSAPCYALAAPGRLLVNLTYPLMTHWRPFDEDACPALPLYLPSLWALSHHPGTSLPSQNLEDYPARVRLIESDPIPRHARVSGYKEGQDGNAVAFLKKKKKRAVPPTVLILGDSVDRNGLTHLCQLMERNVSIFMYNDIQSKPLDVAQQSDLTKGHGARFQGWDQRGLPHMCEIPFYDSKFKPGKKEEIALRVVNGFHYGMDALDEFATPDHVDWHKPGRIEARIDELFVPMMNQLGGVDSVDLIILHSGMWDLALFGLQDDKTNWSLIVPLTPEQLAWWQDRMRRTIYHIRMTFPKARLVLRKLHRTDDVVAGTQYITNLRVHQLRHLQEEVARVEALQVFDFGRLLEGYQGFQEKVHPLLVPGGVVYSQSVLHQLRLAMEDYKR